MAKFYYGGQAVLEGVMMRGQKHMAVAVRKPSGGILVHSEPLKSRFQVGRVGRWPFIRGVVMLADTLVLGMKTLMFSANVALEEEDAEFGSGSMWMAVVFSMVVAVGIFFVVPLLLIHQIDRSITSSAISNLIEGGIRLAFFALYLIGVGRLRDIRRVFSYHGAEHKTINAYEAGVRLEPATVRQYRTAHIRCGTGFLLIVMVIAIFVFTLVGRPSLELRIASRIVLIPVIASVSYEIMRLSARFYGRSRIVRAIFWPSLALQSLTTRQPDDSMLEVAITALKTVLVKDGVLAAEEAPAASGAVAESAEPVPLGAAI